MRRVIAFDVNETLLDLRALDGLFGGAEPRARWFAQTLQLVFVGVITGRDVDLPGRPAGGARDARRRPGPG